MTTRKFIIDDEKVESIYSDDVLYESLFETWTVRRMSHIETDGAHWRVVWLDRAMQIHASETHLRMPLWDQKYRYKWQAEAAEQEVVDLWLTTGKFPGEE